MTESEWLTCTSAQAMLSWLCGRTSARKLRLFACACCRCYWEQLPDEHSRQAVRMAERFADGQASRKELTQARARCSGRGPTLFKHALAQAAAASAAPRAADAALTCVEKLKAQASSVLSRSARQARKAEAIPLPELVRHLFGNPFQPFRFSPTYSTTILQLATALYEGAECAFALHDALLEAGHGELAQHFHSDWHPRGCWAVDGLLHKK